MTDPRINKFKPGNIVQLNSWPHEIGMFAQITRVVRAGLIGKHDITRKDIIFSAYYAIKIFNHKSKIVENYHVYEDEINLISEDQMEDFIFAKMTCMETKC